MKAPTPELLNITPENTLLVASPAVITWLPSIAMNPSPAMFPTVSEFVTRRNASDAIVTVALSDSALPLLTCRTPALMKVAPVNVFAPESAI